MQNGVKSELCVDVTLEKLAARWPKGQAVKAVNLSGKRTEKDVRLCRYIYLCVVERVFHGYFLSF